MRYFKKSYAAQILSFVGVALLMLTGCNKNGWRGSPPPVATAEPPITAGFTDDPGQVTTTATPITPVPTPKTTPTPTLTPTPTPSPTPEPTPEPAPVIVQLSETSADDSFFETAALVGNSLVEGFRLYTGLTTPDYYASTSLSVFGLDSTYFVTLNNGGKGTVYDGLAQETYERIYILLGVNEIGYEETSFVSAYSAMIDKMREVNPDAIYYIMSLTPISESKSASDQYFNMERVGAYNALLLAIAEEKNCLYIDLVEALTDETGFLPVSVTNDGIHMIPEHYLVWLEYLRNHY